MECTKRMRVVLAAGAVALTGVLSVVPGAGEQSRGGTSRRPYVEQAHRANGLDGGIEFAASGVDGGINLDGI